MCPWQQCRHTPGTLPGAFCSAFFPCVGLHPSHKDSRLRAGIHAWCASVWWRRCTGADDCVQCSVH
jgi:hypothetical protein